MNNNEIMQLTVKELKLLAKEKGLKGYSKLLKSQLIELLREPTISEKFLSELPEDIEIIQYKDHDKWLETRKLGIGGSDIGAILSVNKYKGIVDVWNDKVNGSEFKGNRFTHFGHKLEPVVAEEFSERFPEFSVTELDRTLKKNHSLANIDRLLWHPSKGYGVLECKTTSAFGWKEWEGEEIPQSYYCQVMHYLAVTGLQYAYVACLIGGNSYKVFNIERNDEECEFILENVEWFWKTYVETKNPPPPDGSEHYSQYQKSKINDLEDNAVDFEPDSSINRYDEISEQIKILEKEQNSIKQSWIDKMIESNASKATIGEHKISTIIQTRETIDKKKLKEEIEDYEKFFTKKETKFYKFT